MKKEIKEKTKKNMALLPNSLQDTPQVFHSQNVIRYPLCARQTRQDSRKIKIQVLPLGCPGDGMVDFRVSVTCFDQQNGQQRCYASSEACYFRLLSLVLLLLLLLLWLVGLEFELEGLHLQNRHSTAWFTPPVHFGLLIL
jgi:hypothetical protein